MKNQDGDIYKTTILGKYRFVENKYNRPDSRKQPEKVKIIPAGSRASVRGSSLYHIFTEKSTGNVAGFLFLSRVV